MSRRGQSGGWRGEVWNLISNNVEKFNFHLILMGFFPNVPYEKFNNSDTSFEDNTSQSDNWSSHIIYCVQHIILSNIILCPHLPKGSFVHLSHVDMLLSYHAGLCPILVIGKYQKSIGCVPRIYLCVLIIVTSFPFLNRLHLMSFKS